MNLIISVAAENIQGPIFSCMIDFRNNSKKILVRGIQKRLRSSEKQHIFV